MVIVFKRQFHFVFCKKKVRLSVWKMQMLAQHVKSVAIQDTWRFNVAISFLWIQLKVV